MNRYLQNNISRQMNVKTIPDDLSQEQINSHQALNWDSFYDNRKILEMDNGDKVIFFTI